MKSKKEKKEIHTKNRTCYNFDNTIRLWDRELILVMFY